MWQWYSVFFAIFPWHRFTTVIARHAPWGRLAWRSFAHTNFYRRARNDSLRPHVPHVPQLMQVSRHRLREWIMMSLWNRSSNSLAQCSRKYFFVRIPIQTPKVSEKNLGGHTGKHFRLRIRNQTQKYSWRHFDENSPENFNSQFTSHLEIFLMNHFATKFTRSLHRQKTKHLWILVLVSALSACSSGPLNQPCPEQMERGPDRVCHAVGDPSAHKPPNSILPFPTPNDGNDPPIAPPKRCPEEPAFAKIHEVLIDPDGPDKDHEWIELLVEEDGLLDGSYVLIRHSHLEDPTMRIPLQGAVRKGELLLIADKMPDTTLFGCAFTGGCLRNGGGVIELYSCRNERIHSVAWGSATATRLAIRSGFSLSWCAEQQQWALSVPNLGSPETIWRNAEACPPSCEPPDRLVFNEVLYDLIGADDGGEFIELLGPPTTSLHGVSLHAVNGSNGKPLFKAITLHGMTDEQGYYLIAGHQLDERDQDLPTQLQNGPEALYLESCDGIWLDAMTYGGHSEFLEPYGEASPVLPEGQSLGRFPDGASTLGTMEDYQGLEPTPRRPNTIR